MSTEISENPNGSYPKQNSTETILRKRTLFYQRQFREIVERLAKDAYSLAEGCSEIEAKQIGSSWVAEVEALSR